jgi:phage shock protein C
MTNVASSPILFGRPDTMLGICEGIGRDLGFNPNWLRAALGLFLLFQPVLVLSTYAAMGVVVLASRLIFPAPRAIAPGAAAPAATANDDAEADAEEFALAA